MKRLAELPERHPGRVIAAVGMLFALAYGSSVVFLAKPGGRVIVGDAVHHYVQLRSALFDRDLQFRNEYVQAYGLRGGEPGSEWIYESTPTGHVRNLMPVGPAILWAPLFLLVWGVAALGNLFGLGYPLDGYGRAFQAAAGLTGVAAAALGAWLTYLACTRVASRRSAIWGTLVLWGASSAIYYSLISPAYSHAASLLATSAFWCVWLRTRADQSPRRYALVGFMAGCAALMRWQDAIILGVPMLELLLTSTAAFGASDWIKRVAARALACSAAALVAFAPQMFVWKTLYGTLFALPQGEGFMRWGEPALAPVLFSANHGLFTWTPVVLLAVAGLFWLARRDRPAAIAAAAFFLMSWYTNAAVADWWAGEAFGARRFVSCFPVFAMGLAALLDRWHTTVERLALAGAAVVAHTFLLLVQYQAFMHGMRDVAPYPAGGYALWLARFAVPFDILRHWLDR
jgi:hypothetical protein